MHKILLFSHSGFSDTDANGITMKNLLSAWDPEEKTEFYCDVQTPDFTAACSYFRVTDMQMLKMLIGKKSQSIFRAEIPAYTQSGSTGVKSAPAKKIPAWLKKQKYNFGFKWAREWLRDATMTHNRSLQQWIQEIDPDVIVYMVGESIFMDKLVLRACEKFGKPLVLYNGEAYRIIDLAQRHGLERAYYKKCEAFYAELNEKAKLVIYNSEMLKADYQTRYPSKTRSIVAYNSAELDCPEYQAGDSTVKVTYFGNLGVGRSESLLKVADALQKISPKAVLDIYGNATTENQKKIEAHPSVCYHGFVDAQQLRQIVAQSDILIHVESFDETIVPKLKYAFSTKIAQCLCAGRCFVSFAPVGTASSQYLARTEGAILVSEETALEQILQDLIENPVMRQEYAQKAAQTGLENHQMEVTARRVRKEIEAII